MNRRYIFSFASFLLIRSAFATTYSAQLMYYGQTDIVLDCWVGDFNGWASTLDWWNHGWDGNGYGYYRPRGSSSSYYGRSGAITLTNYTTDNASAYQTTIERLKDQGDLSLVDFSELPTIPDEGDLVVFTLREVGSACVNGDGEGYVVVNSSAENTGEREIVSATVGDDGYYHATGYDTDGTYGDFSFYSAVGGQDYQIIASFTAIQQSVSTGSNGTTVGDNTSDYLGIGESSSTSVAGLTPTTLDSTIVATSTDSQLDYTLLLQEIISGQQANLNYLVSSVSIPSDLEINQSDIIPSDDQFQYISDDVDDTLSSLPSSSDSVNTSFSLSDSFSTHLQTVFGSFPSVGTQQFSNNFSVSLGSFDCDVSIDFSRYPLSTIRAAFAFVIMFLASVYSVRVVGSAFEA